MEAEEGKKMGKERHKEKNLQWITEKEKVIRGKRGKKREEKKRRQETDQKRGEEKRREKGQNMEE